MASFSLKTIHFAPFSYYLYVYIALTSWLLSTASMTSNLYTRSSRPRSWQASAASWRSKRAVCRAVFSLSFSLAMFSHTCLPYHTAGAHILQVFILKICGPRLFRLDHCHITKPLFHAQHLLFI